MTGERIYSIVIKPDYVIGGYDITLNWADGRVRTSHRIEESEALITKVTEYADKIEVWGYDALVARRNSLQKAVREGTEELADLNQLIDEKGQA